MIAFIIANWKAFAAAALIGVVALFYNLHVDKLIRVAVTKAVTQRDGEWRKSEEAAIEAARKKAQATEAAHAKDLDEIEKKHRKEMEDATKQADARIASVHAGYRLRISAGCTGAGNGAQVAAAAPGSDGTAGAQFLSEADSAFLIGEAKRADDIVRQLRICQETIDSDRKEFTQ